MTEEGAYESYDKADMLLINEVVENQNLYDVYVVAGEVGFGTGSHFLKGMKDDLNTTKWLLITNCLAVNTVMQGQCTEKSASELYMGPGDYSSLVTFDDTTTYTNGTSDERGSYPLAYFGFGQYHEETSGDTTTQYYWME